MSKTMCANRSGPSVTKKSAVLLGLLTMVQGRKEQSELLFDQMVRDEHREALAEVPAPLIKSMLLSMLQEEARAKPQKAERPRKPNLKSPLEEQKDKNKGKNKYEKALSQRLRQNAAPFKANQHGQAFDKFQGQEDLKSLTPFERTLGENRHQREFLLDEFRKKQNQIEQSATDSEFSLDDDDFESRTPQSKKAGPPEQFGHPAQNSPR